MHNYEITTSNYKKMDKKYSIILIITLACNIIANILLMSENMGLKEDKGQLLKQIIKLKKEKIILYNKLKECDNAYTENYKKLDSTVKSNSNISDRVINYLHQEYKYKKEKK